MLDGKSFVGLDTKFIVIAIAVMLLFSGVIIVNAAITSLTITYPNGGENVTGSAVDINWTAADCTGVENVSIYLGTGGSIGNPASSKAINTSGTINCSLGTYDWNTTGESDGVTYQIKVAASADPSNIYGYSAAFFTIDNTAPGVNLINSSFNTTSTTPNIYFNFTDSLSSTANCILYFNGVSKGTNATTAKDTTTNITAEALDDASYQVYVNCTDLAGNINKSSNITVIVDTSAPGLDTVTIASNNTNTTLAKVGDKVTLTIVANESIGTPTVTINNTAATVSGSDTSWTANHTMQTGDSEGTVSFTINFNDITGNAGTEVTALTGGNNVTFDKTAPTVATVTLNDTSPVKAGNVTFNITFTEATSGMDNSTNPVVQITLANSTNHTLTKLSYSSSGKWWYGYYDMSNEDNDGTVDINISGAKDNAGNTMTANNTNTFVFDTTNPGVNLINSSFNTTSTTPNIYFNFTDSLSSTANCILYFNGVSKGTNATTAKDTTTNITAEALDDASYQVYVNCTDLAGNINKSSNITVIVDTSAPGLDTVTIASNNTNTTLAKVGDKVTLTIVANESIGTPTVTINNTAATVSGSDTSWTANHTMQTGDSEGTVSFTINFNDITGNAGTEVTALTGGNNVTFDKTAPTVATVTLNDTSPVKAGNVTFNITFTEATSGMDNSTNPVVQITLANSTNHTLTKLSYSSSGKWWYGYYDMSNEDNDGTVDINISGAKDNAGNTMTANNTNTFVFDTTNPGVTVTLNDTTPTKAGNVTFNLTFNETMDNGTTPVVKINGTTINTTGWESNNLTWMGWYNFTTSTTDGNYTINVTGALDAAGNTIAEDTSNWFVLDTTDPVGNITFSSYGWTSGGKNITFNCTDTGGSGCNSTFWYLTNVSGSCPTDRSSYLNQTDSNMTVSSDNNNYVCLYIEDLAGNTNITKSNDTLKIDGTSPNLTAGTYNHSSKNLTLVFDDTINTVVNMSKVGISNASSGGDSFYLTSTENSTCSASGTNVSCNLSDTHRDQIVGWQGAGTTTLYVSILAGAVKDKAEKDNVASSITITGSNWTNDSSAPTVSSVAYDATTKQMVITFSEAMDVSTASLSRIQIHNTTSTLYDLAGVSASSTDATTLNLTLTTAQNTKMTNLGSDPKLTVMAGAVKDLAGNNNTKASGTDIGLDSDAPTLSATGHTYTYSTNELVLNFSEDIDASATNVSRIYLSSTSDGSGKANHSLSGATTPATDGKTLTINLSDADRIEIDSWSADNIYVTFSDSAFADMAGNNISANTTGTEIDTYIKKDQIALTTGWNLISVPYYMNASQDTFTELLAGYDPTVCDYDGSWMDSTTVDPLYGYFVNVNHTGIITLHYDNGNLSGQVSRPKLSSGNWYTIGASTETAGNVSSVLMIPTESKYLNKLYYGVGSNEAYITRESGNMVFGRGYWLFAKGTIYLAS